MPETLEFAALSSPSAALGGSLGWSSSETPLPETVFLDGAVEAALIGRSGAATCPERRLSGEEDAAHLLLIPWSCAAAPSGVITERWVESLTRAVDGSRAELQLLRRAVSFALQRWISPTELSVEPRLRTVRPTQPLKLTPLRAAREAKSWLDVSWDGLALVAGVNPGTFHYWQANPSANPRPSTVISLYRLHGSLAAGRRAAGNDAAFQEWLQNGHGVGDTPRQLALSGDIDGLKALVQQLIFADPVVPQPARSRRFSLDIDDVSATDGSPGVPALRRKATRRARARLK